MGGNSQEVHSGTHTTPFTVFTGRACRLQVPEPTGESEEPEVRLAQQQTVWDEPKTVHRITTGHAR